ncbi:MAG TPA: HlyD family efflux transporter periplasmic adaptor subunit [Candidatus Woesebacteria bacterium]|nr:HlyD family efflux transporter periplasmic adaptor subunit [Candidatus Woesebacteria bacterium]
MQKIIQKIKKFLNFIKQLSLKKKIIILALLVLIAVLLKLFVFNSPTAAVTYETAVVTKGTLITTVSGSGTITSVNSTDISSKVSGVVKAVYVSNGDSVTKGQKIALVELDEYALERQSSAWASYLNAQEAVKTALKNKSAADIAMWQAREVILKAEDDIEYKNTNSINPDTKEEYTLSEKTIIDKSLEQSKLAFSEAETKYKNADAEIEMAKTQVTSALRDYQTNSATITAPVAGVVSNLNLAAGMTITSSSSGNNSANENSVSGTASQTFGKVSDPDGSLLATISLSEIDVINVKANQKVTLIFDAYEDKTFTGKVLAVDTDGTISSGVTSYSVTIILDPVDVEVYSNMAVTADIITDIQTDVLMLPTAAIQTINNQSFVQILKDNVLTDVNVEVGSANDSYTIIKSGLNEGDEVVTSVITDATDTNTSSTNEFSPFSGLSTSKSSSSSRSGGNGIDMMTGGIGGRAPGGF